MKLGHDKLVHLVMGLTVGIISGIGCLVIGIDVWWALVAVAAVGAAKEAWDAAGHGTVEFLDWLATLAGGLIAVGIFKALG